MYSAGPRCKAHCMFQSRPCRPWNAGSIPSRIGQQAPCLRPCGQQLAGSGGRGAYVHRHTPCLTAKPSRPAKRLQQDPPRATSAADAAADSHGMQSYDSIDESKEPIWEGIVDAWERFKDVPAVKTGVQVTQFAASLLFVVLYVWATYNQPRPFSLRFNLDILLCVVFALDYALRYLAAESKLRMVVGFWNILDLLAFLPPLLEACLLHGANVPFKLGRFDLRWFKILRALRVMRISLLAGELKQMNISSSGALLSGAASVRLFQLIASVLTLLFTTSSIIVLVEKLAFHEALYFVITTLTTVGYGDIVMKSALGKVAVLGMICVGVVLIPVQTSQLYSQLTARRVTLGAVPDRKMASVLVSTRLTEVRGFSDFFSEFYQALKKSRLPQNLQMVVLCNRPNFEFRAFQELNDKKLTLMEGSALSERDLLRAKAEAATACLLLADRFSPKPEEEDLNLQFQVWALKSYTKRVPLYVQVLQQSSIKLLAPFLDPEKDVLVSTEQTRHRLLALSCLCPGASTLIANLLRRASVLPKERQRRTAGGRRWLRAYLNGCAFKVFDSKLGPSLAKVPFSEAAEWLYRTSGFVLMGVVRDKQVVLNPGRRRLQGGEAGIIIGTSQQAVDAALDRPFTVAPAYSSPDSPAAQDATSLANSEGGATLPLREAANKLIDGGKKPVEAASKLITNGKKPVEAAASWVTHIKDAINVTRKRPQAAKASGKRKPGEPQKQRDEYFYPDVFPEDIMPCVLDSPFCKYDRYAAEYDSDEDGRVPSPEEEQSRGVEGYFPEALAYVSPEASDSYDEEDDVDARRVIPGGLQRNLKMTLKDFYANLGDLTAPKRQQPGLAALTPKPSSFRPLTSKYQLTGTDSDSDDESDGEERPWEEEVEVEDGNAAAEDPDIYSSSDLDEESSVREDIVSDADSTKEDEEPARNVDLPELTTESYDEDPEDEEAFTLQQILAAKGHDNLHAELDQDCAIAVADSISHASLERGRLPLDDASAARAAEQAQKASQEAVPLDSQNKWTFDTEEPDYKQEAMGDIDEFFQEPDHDSDSDEEEENQDLGLSNHIIISGAPESFLSFAQQIRKCDPVSTTLVILHSELPKKDWPQIKALSPVHFVQGVPSDAASLQQANASQARALVFLAHPHRPYRAEDVSESDRESSFASRTAVLADAQGLLCSYGVGEDGSANLPHAVVELCFTSSVRFLQPGLLLKGQGFMDEQPNVSQEGAKRPRKSWEMRRRQERAAIKEGLAEWQANPYFCAGRVTVPAIMDTFACQCFFNQGMLTDLMEELAGDDGRAGGAQLRQVPLPKGMAGKTYGELVAKMTLTQKLLPLGLYRRKSENAAWRLYYVVTNPPPEEKLDKGDRVFVLRERGGPWLTAAPP